MKIAFKIECPHCHWGIESRNDYVNQGWVKLECGHCDKTFYTKVAVPYITVETEKELPEGAPWE